MSEPDSSISERQRELADGDSPEDPGVVESGRAESSPPAPPSGRGQPDDRLKPGIDVPASPLGDFQIVKELARGGMGIVYEAIQLSLGRRVALKVLPFAATLDFRQLQRFKSEAQAAALLHHTNIVPVFAVGCERGVHFYAMQLIEGQSLAALISQLRRSAGLERSGDFPADSAVHSSHVLGTVLPADSSAASRAARGKAIATPFPETAPQFHADLSTQHVGRDIRFFQTAARLMLQAALALEHAHQFGVIHRDIKPANLLLDAQGVLWVTDFGLAQFRTDASLTRTGDIPGTIRYMSPEQAAGRRELLDLRTDVYSLGATFYELLTLQPIFDGRDVQYLLHQVLHTEPRGLRQRDKSIPVELETIVLKSLSKNPDERYRSAGDLAADLQRYLDNEPILARRPTLFDLARKWSRRHPSAVIAAVLILATITVGSLVSNYREQLRANEAEQRFRQARQAVDVLIEVSEGELADNPGVRGTRQRLLGIALGYYQEFIDQRRGDAAGQAELAAVQERVKGILRELAILQRDMHRRALEKPGVQEALELTDAQKQRLTPLLAKWDQEWESDQQEIWKLDEDARRRRLVVSAEGHDRALDEILSSRQRQRLAEIVIQDQGIFAFKDPEIVQTLQLSPEQRKHIRQIEHEVFALRFGSPRRNGGSEGKRGGPERLTKRESVARVLKVFTEDQLGTWRDLTGAPFAGLDEAPFPGRRGYGSTSERR